MIEGTVIQHLRDLRSGQDPEIDHHELDNLIAELCPFHP